MKKISIKTLYLIAVISIGLIGLGVGSTFAVFTASANISDPISITSSLNYSDDILEVKEINVLSNETKTINFSIVNSSSSTLNYTAWSINDNEVSTGLANLNNNTTGTIGAGSTITLDIVLKNTSNVSKKVTIGVSSSSGPIVLSSTMTRIPYEVLS